MEDLIIVTGYGQFAGHEINASGEAVKLLPKEIIVGSKKYEIRTIEVSVEYSDVDKKIEEIWKLRPYLVVHCGE
jgi:pyrrolidone-carboxylate peptidase